MATVLHPGRLSPTRQVPADIPRPEYVGRKHPRSGEPDVKTPEIIARMRVASKIAAQALAAVGAAVAPGVTTGLGVALCTALGMGTRVDVFSADRQFARPAFPI